MDVGCEHSLARHACGVEKFTVDHVPEAHALCPQAWVPMRKTAGKTFAIFARTVQVVADKDHWTAGDVRTGVRAARNVEAVTCRKGRDPVDVLVDRFEFGRELVAGDGLDCAVESIDETVSAQALSLPNRAARPRLSAPIRTLGANTTPLGNSRSRGCARVALGAGVAHSGGRRAVDASGLSDISEDGGFRVAVRLPGVSNLPASERPPEIQGRLTSEVRVRPGLVRDVALARIVVAAVATAPST